MPIKPRFLITIDTEGDNGWDAPRQVTTRNSKYLPRFQALCERFNFKPTWLTNWEMANCPDFVPFAQDALRRGTAEVGMHLHAWNSPPLDALTSDDTRHMPFLIEYPEEVMRLKIVAMTQVLEAAFGRKMLSHRAGRWSFNAAYARILVEHGYRVDCSVTPYVSWRKTLGDPAQSGGTDFSAFPHEPYWMDLGDISRPGSSPLLEVPMTILPGASPLAAPATSLLPSGALPRRALNKLFDIEASWLRPSGGNLKAMLRVVERAWREKRSHLEFMLHSSEFMPGGSPTFATEQSIEALYRDLEALFGAIRPRFEGATLSEFHDEFAASQPAPGTGAPAQN